MKESSAKPATMMPKTGGGKGANIQSPFHTSVTGATKVGSKISMKGASRSASSKR